MNKSKVISVINRKGGVAKTTTCRTLASIYAKKGKNVLLIDFDPQASLTKSFALDDRLFEGTSENNICNIFRGETVSPIDIGEEGEVVHIIPSNKGLETISLEGVIGRDLALRKFFKKSALLDFYDIVIIDNNPSFGVMSVNTVLVANTIIIPVITSKKEVEGLHAFLDLLNETLETFSHSIDKLVVVPTIYDKKTNVDKMYLKFINEDTLPYIDEACYELKETVCTITPPIPKTVVFKSADAYNLSPYDYLVRHGNKTNMDKEKREELALLLEFIADTTIGKVV